MSAKRELLVSDANLNDAQETTEFRSVPIDKIFRLRDIYEAARAKDGELIQRLVDALAEQVQPSLDERFRGEVWYRHMAIIKDAEAAGFTPSE